MKNNEQEVNRRQPSFNDDIVNNMGMNFNNDIVNNTGMNLNNDIVNNTGMNFKQTDQQNKTDDDLKTHINKEHRVEPHIDDKVLLLFVLMDYFKFV